MLGKRKRDDAPVGRLLRARRRRAHRVRLAAARPAVGEHRRVVAEAEGVDLRERAPLRDGVFRWEVAAAHTIHVDLENVRRAAL